MQGELRQALRKLWDSAAKDGHARWPDEKFVSGHQVGRKSAVRAVWEVEYGDADPPCRHCWEPEGHHDTCETRRNGCPITDLGIPGTYYEPVRGW